MDTSNRTFVSSILFLDIVEYSKQSVTDQLALKQQFNNLLVDALKHVAASDRIVLDTGDGAAVSFQGNPEDSLFAGMHMRDAIASLPVDALPRLEVRFGINLGPVRLIKDINGQLNIIGDGINVAQRVMSFAEPGCILVSRSYFEVVSRLSDDYAKIFSAAGTRTDKHVREHSVYEIGKSLDAMIEHRQAERPVQEIESSSAIPEQNESRSSDLTQKIARKYWLAGGLAGTAAILGLLFFLTQHNDRSLTVAQFPASPEKSTPALPKPTATKKSTAAPSAATAAPAKPSVAPTQVSVVLSIKPWGEVYVDGKKKGISPPLKSVLLTPGTHVLEIRNSNLTSYMKTLNIKAGDTPRIEHKF